MVVEYAGMLSDSTTCRLTIAGDSIRAHIDRRFGKDPRELFKLSPIPNTLVLDIGGSEFATLTGLSLISRTAQADNEQQILNVARVVVGPAAFLGDGCIEGLRFVPTNQAHAIYYTHHRTFGGLASLDSSVAKLVTAAALLGRYQIDVVDNERLEAARIIHGSTSVCMDIAVFTSHNRQGTQWSEQRRVTIGYEKGSKLSPAIADVQYICSFMSMMLGKIIGPTEISFQVMSPKRAETGKYRLYARFRVPAPAMRLADLNTGLVSPHEDRPKYEMALAAWLGRRDAWQKSTAFALDALEMSGRLDRTRFLNATGWFEAIPPTYLKGHSTIPKGDLDKAAGLASEFLDGKGHTDLNNRIRAMMGNLNNASLAVRLQKAIAFLREQFGTAVLPSSAERDSRLISAIRGSYAHGDDPLLGRHAAQVMELTLLTEAVCYLLTIAGLGMGPGLGLGVDHTLPAALGRLALLAEARARRAKGEP